MSSFLSNRKDTQAGVRIDESLALRVRELQDTLTEHDQLVTDGCSVLTNAASSLASVRAKYEPVKAHASALSSTSTNAAQVSSDLFNLANSLRVHNKLDKATQRAGSDADLSELLSALEDTIKNNDFLLKFDQLEIAMSALAKNRESTAHAARACAASFDRIVKAHSTIPPLSALEAVLAKPPSERPKAEDVFFSGKAREVKSLTHILQLMNRIGESACLDVYIASRKQAVQSVMQVVATSVVVTAPTGAHSERQIFQWENQMRMLAQVLEWEDRLARNMLPGAVLTESLQSILGDTVERTVSTGHKLAAGRADREQIFPLLDMIVCMHDPYVLPSMKKAFRSQTMSHLKSRFLELLTELCGACESCVKAFTASLAGEPVPLAKDGGAQTTIAAQTAFAMRVLKNIFRKDVQGKLPFMTDGRTFAVDTLSALLSGLEGRLQPALRALPGALNVAMLNNLRYILVGIQEHSELANVLGSGWRAQHEGNLERRQQEYFQESWDPVVALLKALRANVKNEAKRDAMKDDCKKVNARLERILTTQAPWAMPDEGLRRQLLSDLVAGSVVPLYTEFWRDFEGQAVFKTPAKYLKYPPAEVKAMITQHLFTSALLRPGVVRK